MGALQCVGCRKTHNFTIEQWQNVVVIEELLVDRIVAVLFHRFEEESIEQK